MWICLLKHTRQINEAIQSYLLKGVKFDGYKNGVLIEAKGKYSQFLKGEEFAEWFQKTGQKKLLDQANRQVNAAGWRAY